MLLWVSGALSAIHCFHVHSVFASAAWCYCGGVILKLLRMLLSHGYCGLLSLNLCDVSSWTLLNVCILGCFVFLLAQWASQVLGSDSLTQLWIYWSMVSRIRMYLDYWSPWQQTWRMDCWHTEKERGWSERKYSDTELPSNARELSSEYSRIIDIIYHCPCHVTSPCILLTEYLCLT